MNTNTRHSTSTIHNSSIQINDFRLRLHIGVGDEERVQKQDVFVSLNLNPLTPELIFTAGASDDIDDTVDYHALCNYLKQLEDKRYNLIERLASDIFHLIAKFLDTNCSLKCPFAVQVEICKRPQITDLEGDIRFVLKGGVDLS